RQRDLFRRIAVVLRRSVDVVDERVVTAQANVEILVERMRDERAGASRERNVKVCRGRDVGNVEAQAIEESANASMRRRRWLFFLGRPVGFFVFVFPAVVLLLLLRRVWSWSKLGRRVRRSGE